MKNFKILLTVLLFVSIFSIFASGEPTGILKGKVIDLGTGKPVEDAKIEIEKLNISRISSRGGFYTIAGIKIGFYNIKVSHPQYQTKVTQGVGVAANIVTIVNFKLGHKDAHKKRLLDYSIDIDSGVLEGWVRDYKTKKPISLVKIYIPELKKAVLSDINGYFQIDNIKKGNYNMHITHLDYNRVVFMRFRIQGNLVITRDIKLEKLSTQKYFNEFGECIYYTEDYFDYISHLLTKSGSSVMYCNY
ncbi:carboxypeptidase regulatory-like domain-containing protein, partial [Candidatus Dependentiae bacterium]|nr:carboxypeptidase regulatory-like domain-containing protein [Candidatus Dependentiae bacterium]